MSSSRIRLVIFDWAGTLIDFGSCAPMAAFMQVFADRGVAVTPAEARKPMGTHKKEHLLAMLREPAIRRRWEHRHGDDWQDADVEEMYRDLVPKQLATIEQHADLVPGVLECAAELRANEVMIGGTTGYFQAAADRVLAAAARQGFMPDASVCGDEVPMGRPAPWMIYRVMEMLRVYPPWQVLKIGDTRVDIEEGLNAGCWSVGVTSSSSEMGLEVSAYASLEAEERKRRLAEVRDTFFAAGAHAVIESLHQVPALVERVNGWLSEDERP